MTASLARSNQMHFPGDRVALQIIWCELTRSLKKLSSKALSAVGTREYVQTTWPRESLSPGFLDYHKGRSVTSPSYRHRMC